MGLLLHKMGFNAKPVKNITYFSWFVFLPGRSALGIKGGNTCPLMGSVKGSSPSVVGDPRPPVAALEFDILRGRNLLDEKEIYFRVFSFSACLMPLTSTTV